MSKLSPKQQQFCQEYIVDLNATQAAIRAGYSPKGANSKASQLLAKVNIQQEVQRLMDERSRRTEITQDMVLRELAKLGFSNMQNLYTDEGSLIPVHQLDPDVSACLQEVWEDSVGSDEGSVVIKRKYKMSDKKSSLELIGRHLKMFTDKVETTGQDGGPIKTQNEYKVTFVSSEGNEIVRSSRDK